MTGEAELIWEAELGSWSHAPKAELERAYRALDDEIAPVLARRVVRTGFAPSDRFRSFVVCLARISR